jgi:hypothetical protein
MGRRWSYPVHWKPCGGPVQGVTFCALSALWRRLRSGARCSADECMDKRTDFDPEAESGCPVREARRHGVLVGAGQYDGPSTTGQYDRCEHDTRRHGTHRAQRRPALAYECVSGEAIGTRPLDHLNSIPYPASRPPRDHDRGKQTRLIGSDDDKSQLCRTHFGGRCG